MNGIWPIILETERTSGGEKEAKNSYEFLFCRGLKRESRGSMQTRRKAHKESEEAAVEKICFINGKINF